jgi:hypothetical protein
VEDAELFVRSAPACVSHDALLGLINIVNRGKLLVDFVSQTWNLPLHTPSQIILQRCEQAAELFRTLPLELNSLQRAVNACLLDSASRHCTCRKFDDGKVMLSCARCGIWFHAQCVGITQAVEEDSVVDFVCHNCEMGLN